MAAIVTKNSVAGDLIVFDALFSKAYPNYKKMDVDTLLRLMISDGTIQMDAVVEKSISKVGKLTRCNEAGMDFTDGSDAKKAVATKASSKTSSRKASVGSISTKKGMLRVVVAEPACSSLFYYRIPYKAYKGIKRLNFTFDKNGTPGCLNKFDPYRVKSFKQLCS